MRRKNLGSKLVKKCIVWAMTFMMIFTPVVSNIGTMTVYAEEPTAEPTELGEEGTSESEKTAEETAEMAKEIVNELADDVAEAATPVTVVTNADAALGYVETTLGEVVSTDEEGNSVISIERVIGEAETTAEAAAAESDVIVGEVDKTVEDVLNDAGNVTLEDAKGAVENAQKEAKKQLKVAQKAEEEASQAYEEAKDKAYEAEIILGILEAYQKDPASLDAMIAKAESETNKAIKAKVEALIALGGENGIEEAKKVLEAAEGAETQAKLAVEGAEAQTTQAEEVVQAIEDAKGKIKEKTGKSIDVAKAEESITTSLETLENAKDPEVQEAAKEKVDSLSETIANEQDKLKAVKEALVVAKDAVSKVRKALQTAQNNVAKLNVYSKWVNDENFSDHKTNYAGWNKILNNEDHEDQYTLVYAQKDENGNAVWENKKAFDTTDEDVKSRSEGSFIEVSEGSKKSNKDADIKIPESVMIAFVDYMSRNYQASNLKGLTKNEKLTQQAAGGGTQGKGIAIGESEAEKGVSATMPEIYWEVNEDNYYLTEEYHESIDELVEGKTYFLGYTFKVEGDGYHIDGYLFKHNGEAKRVIFKVPTTPDVPTPTPGDEPTPTPPTPGDEPTPDVVIIPDAPVALAAAPVAADNGAAVLGARRTDGDATEAAVLGARRGTEQAVLGKRRKPQTGDTAALNAWMAAMTMAAGAAGISGTKLAKGKKKEEKED